MDSVPTPSSTFGIELIRDYVLMDLLGTDYRHVIYWAGKRLAREFPVLSAEEAPPFFHEAGWGHLELKKQKGNSLSFLLTPPESTRLDRSGRLLPVGSRVFGGTILPSERLRR